MAGALLALASLACANRGMFIPLGTGGAGGGGGGTGAGGNRVDGGGMGGSVDGGGTGGRGTGGGNGGSGVGGANTCNDGGASADAAACTAVFNFENCALYGSTIVSPSDLSNAAGIAFTGFSNVSDSFCGSGALKIDTAFFPPTDGGANGGQGSLIGELTIPVVGNGSGREDLSGKTLTIHIKVSPPATSRMQLYVYAIDNTFEQAVMLNGSQLTDTWQTWSYTFAPVDGGVDMTTGLAIEALGRGDTYTGAIYIDELDIKAATPDAGAPAGQ